MKLQSFAKINLTLDILHKRPDGFHELETVFQQIGLHDEIELSEIPQGIEIDCDIDGLNSSDNIAYKAAALIKEKFKVDKGVKISIKKNIPIGAGLSGGSSNAAAVLKGLNELWNLRLEKEKLLSLAAELGSDVCFHLFGGTCLGKGRGEIIEKIPNLAKHYVIVVYPEFSISTKEAYSTLGKHIGKKRATRSFIPNYDLKYLHNDFEENIFSEYAILSDIKEDLGPNSLLSGSGSCVFGLYSEKKEAEKRYHALQQKYTSIFLTETISHGI